MSDVVGKGSAASDGPDRIELLGVDWLAEEGAAVETFRSLARRLGIDLGWHYPIDLAWIARHLGNPAGLTILDAGAGTGVLQWWLADRGAVVISADRQDRGDISPRFRARYHVEGMDSGSLVPLLTVAHNRLRDVRRGLIYRASGWSRAVGGHLLERIRSKSRGTVVIYHSDLKHLDRLSDESVDAVVSLSALEHNKPNDLGSIVDELWRVLRPGGRMLLTVSAALGADWYHVPSSGWCFGERSLRRYFRFPRQSASSFASYEALLGGLRSSRDLRAWLSPLYYRSGDNGMPWGVWDPKYLPVGIRKVKRIATFDRSIHQLSDAELAPRRLSGVRGSAPLAVWQTEDS